MKRESWLPEGLCEAGAGMVSLVGKGRKGKAHANLSPECKCKDPNEILVNLEEHYITEK